MSLLVHLAMFGWIFVILALFILLPPRRAVIVAFVGGWLFLPLASYSLPGIPDYSKEVATCVGTLLAIAVFDSRRLRHFRLRSVDLPMLVWCLSPFVSAITNGMGLWEGSAAVFAQLVSWGIPYFIGRIYFRDVVAFRDLALGIVIGGLLYMPLVLWEVRMSPHIHSWVYGYSRMPFSVLDRYGGWRPLVFMQTPLMVATWIASASLCAFWLSASRSVRQIAGIPLGWLVPPLMITTVLCKQVGAFSLMLVGMGLFVASKWLHGRWFVMALVLVASSYVPLRLTGALPADRLLNAAEGVYHEDRVRSLGFRLFHEDLLAEKAMERPLFGWGRFARARVRKEGKDISVTDGLWIIALGRHGLVGLGSLIVVFLLPPFLVASRCSPKLVTRPREAPLVLLSILSALYWVDNLFNAMINPVLVLVVGAVSSAVAVKLPQRGSGPPRRGFHGVSRGRAEAAATPRLPFP